MWGLMFTTADCTFARIRGKEDPWNSIMSGFTTGFILALPSNYQEVSSHSMVYYVFQRFFSVPKIQVKFTFSCLLPLPTKKESRIPPFLLHIFLIVDGYWAATGSGVVGKHCGFIFSHQTFPEFYNCAAIILAVYFIFHPPIFKLLNCLNYLSCICNEKGHIYIIYQNLKIVSMTTIHMHIHISNYIMDESFNTAF